METWFLIENFGRISIKDYCNGSLNIDNSRNGPRDAAQSISPIELTMHWFYLTIFHHTKVLVMQLTLMSSIKGVCPTSPALHLP